MLIRDFVDQIFKKPDSLYNYYAKFVVGSCCPRSCNALRLSHKVKFKVFDI